MSNVLDYVLDGLEAALELERELGVRSVEIDRGLLAAPVRPAAAAPVRPAAAAPVRPAAAAPVRPAAVDRPVRQPGEQTVRPLVFVHDRPLSSGGVEMVAKIVTALGLSAEQAPVVVAPPIPNAKMFVFLGFASLKRYMPAMRIEENTWGKSPRGKDILVVKSPEEILRFGAVTPAVKKMKEDMWRSLKAVKQRLALT